MINKEAICTPVSPGLRMRKATSNGRQRIGCVSALSPWPSSAPCVDGDRLATDVVADARIYDQAINGLSMYDFPLAAPFEGRDWQ